MPNDDRLNDTISTVMNITENVGEILGPLLAGFLAQFVEFWWITTALALLFLSYALVYLLVSDYVTFSSKSKRDELSELLLEERTSADSADEKSSVYSCKYC